MKIAITIIIKNLKWILLSSIKINPFDLLNQTLVGKEI